MYCPFCKANETKVIDSRLVSEGNQIRRRRECLFCGERFNTFETADIVISRIIKKDGTREVFDEIKLRAGMQSAIQKRPVSLEDIDQAIMNIKHEMRKIGERELNSMIIGNLVMNELRKLDEVAYIRFASVYRKFKDLDEFKEEIERITKEI